MIQNILLFVFLSLLLVQGVQAFIPVTGKLKDTTDAWFSDKAGTEETYGPISDWDVSGVTDFSSVFAHRYTFNEDLSKWVTSSATTTKQMFQHAYAFNGDLSNFDTSKVTYMSHMFLMPLRLTGICQTLIRLK